METGCIKLSRLRTFQPSESKCGGKLTKISTEEARSCGYRGQITVCLSHLNELKRNAEAQYRSDMYYPSKSCENSCNGVLVPCPQRFFGVFYSLDNECIGTKICGKHLKQADKNNSITKHERYLPPRKRKVGLLVLLELDSTR